MTTVLVVDDEQNLLDLVRGNLGLRSSPSCFERGTRGAATAGAQKTRPGGARPDASWHVTVWTPRARDPQNRESGQTWLRKSLKRLQDELVTAAGGFAGEIVTGTGQLLRPNPATIGRTSKFF